MISNALSDKALKGTVAILPRGLLLIKLTVPFNITVPFNFTVPLNITVPFNITVPCVYHFCFSSAINRELKLINYILLQLSYSSQVQ